MWLDRFEDRLKSWSELRSHCEQLPLKDALDLTANWWGHAPRMHNIIHWNDQTNWPDPWDLLADNSYDELALALGMSYTVSMIDKFDCSVEISQAKDDQGQEYNLVLVDDRKYILNYDPWSSVSKEQFDFKITNFIDARTLRIE
jgi:hypothetical protein